MSSDGSSNRQIEVCFNFPNYAPVGVLEEYSICKPLFTVTEKVLEEVPISEQEKEEKEKLQQQRLAAERASANNKVREGSISAV